MARVAWEERVRHSLLERSMDGCTVRHTVATEVLEEEQTEADPRLLRRPSVSLVAVGSCVLSVAVFGVGARDDDYITYWEAEQLAKTGHLINLNGAPIEQSSSLAHVFVLATLYFVTRLPLPLLGYLVGIACLAITVLLSARLARSIDSSSELPAAVVVAIAYPIVFWSSGGLETLLAAASVLWFVMTLIELLASTVVTKSIGSRFTLSSLLIVTVRPDTMLVGAAVSLLALLVAVLWSREDAEGLRRLPRLSVRRCAAASAVVIGEILLLALLRLIAFGSAVPQPDIAKTGGFSWFRTGFGYVETSFPAWLWLALLALFALGTARAFIERSVPSLLAAATFAIGVVAIMFTRGDWMGGARLLVPYLSPGLVVMVAGVWWLSPLLRRSALVALLILEGATLVLFANGTTWLSSAYGGGYSGTAAFAVGAALGSPFGAAVTSNGPVPPLPWYTSWDYVHTRDAMFLAEATPVLRKILEEASPAKVTIASYQAGMVMYTWDNEFPGRLEFIDTDNLVTTDFSTCAGLFDSYSGQIISLSQWAYDAGGCAPWMPDLFFGFDPPSSVPMLGRLYHLVSSTSMTYDQHHVFGGNSRWGGYEYLYQKNDWHP